jgi:hypothetical protein
MGDNTKSAFDLSPEQRNTASLLDRLLGQAIANRYIDFCRLAAGAFELNVPRPLAAHALRELESTLRDVLAVPLDAKKDQPANKKLLKDARKRLRELNLDDGTLDRAMKALKPQLSHKMQIRRIVARLGLDPAGDIAHQWISLTDSFGRAHERSFHQSLAIDDEFRSRYQHPFETEHWKDATSP